MATTTATAPVKNLRETKREMAGAKRAPAKAPAKRAPAKKQAPATAATPARKLRWTVVEEFAKGKHQTATLDGHTYTIEQAGEGWTASVTVGKKRTVLVESGTFGKCYGACVAHNRNRA